jgi:hypothetical protein
VVEKVALVVMVALADTVALAETSLIP